MTIQVGDASANPVFTDVVQQAQSLGSLNATNSVTLRGQATATVQVTGIGSLTLTFEGSTDGSNFDALLATPIAGGGAVSTTTTNGHWISINTAGLAIFRVRVSAYTSGTATVSVVASQGSSGQNFTSSGVTRVDLASENGLPLGTPTNFGTTPGAVAVVGANASLFVGTTAVRTNQATTATGTVDVNLAGVIGTTAVQAAAGVLRVGIAGSANAVLDSVTTVASTPANNIAVSVANVTTAPSLATGQSVAVQGDYQGSVFVKPYRRGQTGAQTTTISATGATTIVTAGAAGIFNDISVIVITTAGLAVQTITISDGTLSWIIDYPNAILAPGTPFIVHFDPPLKATTAATAWTANQSLATACHYLVNFVLQKAS